jgi:hypothetical protein
VLSFAAGVRAGARRSARSERHGWAVGRKAGAHSAACYDCVVTLSDLAVLFSAAGRVGGGYLSGSSRWWRSASLALLSGSIWLLAAVAMTQPVTACGAAVRRPFSCRGAFSRDRAVPRREPVLRMFLGLAASAAVPSRSGSDKDQRPFAGCHAWPVYWRSVRRGGEAPGCRFRCRRRATLSDLRRRGG